MNRPLLALALLGSLTLSSCSTSGPATAARFRHNPLEEQAMNLRHGDYRYRGLTDAAGHKVVLGTTAGGFPENQVVYLMTDGTPATTEVAMHYLNQYNEALASTRRGKRIDDNGMLVKK